MLKLSKNNTPMKSDLYLFVVIALQQIPSKSSARFPPLLCVRHPQTNTLIVPTNLCSESTVRSAASQDHTMSALGITSLTGACCVFFNCFGYYYPVAEYVPVHTDYVHTLNTAQYHRIRTHPRI